MACEKLKVQELIDLRKAEPNARGYENKTTCETQSQLGGTCCPDGKRSFWSRFVNYRNGSYECYPNDGIFGPYETYQDCEADYPNIPLYCSNQDFSPCIQSCLPGDQVDINASICVTNTYDNGNVEKSFISASSLTAKQSNGQPVLYELPRCGEYYQDPFSWPPSSVQVTCTPAASASECVQPKFSCNAGTCVADQNGTYDYFWQCQYECT